MIEQHNHISNNINAELNRLLNSLKKVKMTNQVAHVSNSNEFVKDHTKKDDSRNSYLIILFNHKKTWGFVIENVKLPS